MTNPVAITAFYKFSPIAERDIERLQQELYDFGTENRMRGLTLLATEGINGTVCAQGDVIEKWKELLEKHFGETIFKDSSADGLVFPRWFVKIRNEIVSLKQDGVEPNGENGHLTPEEWHTMMKNDDVIILDTRNTYETEVGMFEKAVDPKLDAFQDFPTYVEQCDIPKDKKVMMYCTGGIRCEKALIEMKKQGYKHVYQLEGGILAYLKQFPNEQFSGECFVFDHRICVNQDLKPSTRYKACPHCGDPGDKMINCNRCQTAEIICEQCYKDELKRTCSKDCRHHLGRMMKKEAVS